MKNIGRVIVIGILAVVCVICVVLLGRVIRRESVEGITHEEMTILWKALTGDNWIPIDDNQREVIWGDVLKELDELNNKDVWHQVMQESNSDVYQGVQKMKCKYQAEDKIARDDWYGLYQILCTFFASEMNSEVRMNKMVILDKLGNGEWITNTGEYVNESNFDFEKYHNYWVVETGREILTVWKECEDELSVRNVFIEQENNEGLFFFYHNQSIHIPNVGMIEILKKAGRHLYNNQEETVSGRIGDICFVDGKVKEIVLKDEIISGKVMQRTDKSVTLGEEENRQYEFDTNVEVYQTYADLKTLQVEDLPIGYEYADFVLQEGRISAILLTRDESMEFIRVLLKDTSDGDFFYDNFKGTSDTDFCVVQNGVIKPCLAGEVYEIGRTELKIDDRVLVIPSVHSGTILCESIQRSQGTPAYRGHIEVLNTEEGLVIVNEVLLEEYLYTVVPSEMPASYPMEALKAQAVCARTYGYQKMLHALYPQWGAHLDDTTTCQVYNNQTEHINTNQAIRSTFGIVAKKEGILIDTFYYSTSCGFSTTEEIWGNGKKYDYLQAGEISNGEQNSAAEDAASMMNEQCFEQFIRMGNVMDYECEEPWYRWSYHEEVDKKAFFERIQKCYQQSPDKVLLWNDLNQQFESSELPQLDTLNAIEIVRRLPGGVAHEMEIVSEPYRIKVLTEQLIRTILPEPASVIARWDGSEITMSGILPSAFIYLNTEENSESEITELYINGGGYGHGVGMSQNAAAHMAEAGMDMQEILSFFYKGITLEKHQ